MLKNKHAWLLLLLTGSVGVWACSSDDTDSSPNPEGQAGESAAGQRSGGGSPSGGSSTVGGGGKGGNTSAGTASNLAGESTSGGAPTPGASGAPATGGADTGNGGAPAAGGADTGNGGAPADQGGAPGLAGAGGAPSAPTLAENCATVCAAQAGLNCSYGANCVAGCLGIADPDAGTTAPDEYAAMIACEAASLQASDFECSPQGAGPDMPSAKADTSCEAEICLFTCSDGILIDINAFGRCGC